MTVMNNIRQVFSQLDHSADDKEFQVSFSCGICSFNGTNADNIIEHAGALVVLIILGVIPANQAFDGFAHPAVITVALVLIISQGLKNSGLTGLVGKVIGGKTFTQFQFLISLLFIAAILSSFINNIGALAILLPITLNICQKMDWHPSRFLMPLAFACTNRSTVSIF